MNSVIKISSYRFVRVYINKHISQIKASHRVRSNILYFCSTSYLIGSFCLYVRLSSLIEIQFETIHQPMALSITDCNSILLHRRITCRFIRMLVINVGDRTRKNDSSRSNYLNREKAESDMFDSLIFSISRTTFFSSFRLKFLFERNLIHFLQILFSLHDI